MSLKGFHIVFVTVTTILFVFMAVWAFLFAKEISSLTRALGTVGVVGAVVMPVYGVAFYRKASKILL